MKYFIRTPIQVAVPAALAADKKVSAAKAAGTANHMGLVSIVQSSLLFYGDFVTNVTQEIDF
jgi:hypothetical protein